MGRILHRHMPHLSSRVRWVSGILLDEEQKRKKSQLSGACSCGNAFSDCEEVSQSTPAAVRPQVHLLSVLWMWQACFTWEMNWGDGRAMD